jgi:TonB-linked SusC/RagA family outer membrane protein
MKNFTTGRLFVVKQRLLFSLLWLLILTGQVFATLPDKQFQNVKISVKAERKTLKQILQLIESKSGVAFIYSDRLVNPYTNINISVSNEPITSVLDGLLKGTQLTYKAQEKRIILTEKQTINLIDKTAVQGENLARQVSGEVVDEKGDGLPGVSIRLKKSNRGTTTDVQGKFQISIEDDTDILVFSYIGYATQEVRIGNRNVLNVSLTPDQSLLNEVIVTGYTQTKRSAQTGAISTIDSKDLSQASYSSVMEKLQGQVPGLQISSNSGVPGASVLVRLRGATSIKAGNDPLYVVDGVFINNENLQGLSRGMGGQTPNPLSDLNPDDIETVSVLKDANATAIYGSRGANGVILITTKRGSRNSKTKVNLNAEHGFAKATNLWELVSGPEHAALVNLVHLNDGRSFATRPFRPTNEVIAGFPAFGNPEDQGTYDRVSDIFRVAALRKYTLSVSGGDAKTNFYLGGEYQKQESTLKTQDFARYSFRFNIDHSIRENIKIGTSNTLSSVPRRLVRVGDGPAGLFQASLHTPSFYPFYNEDGTYAKPTVFDSHLSILENSDTHSNSLRSVNNVYSIWNILPNLSFKSSWSNDYNNYHEKAYYNTNLVYGQPAGEANDVTTIKQTLIAEQLLSYNFSTPKSEFAIFVGNTVQTTKTERAILTGTGFPSNQFKRIASAAVQTASSTGSEYGLLSYFTGANYSYDNRYSIDANLRADASSRFGADNRWGFFPSVGLGWNISKESFFPENKIVDDLRFKASIGLTGNQDIDDFASRGLWAGGTNYGDQPGIAPSQLANPDLKWETTRQYNFGLTGTLINKRLNFEFNYYDKFTYDLLLDQPVAPNTGFSSVVRNVGEISNRGVELLLNSIHVSNKDLTWKSTLSISKNVNKVKKLLTPITASYNMFRVEEGYPLYSVFAYNELGVNPETGNAIFEDVNKDGRITVDDQKIVGNVWPDFEGAFRNTVSYKGFDLNLNFYYKYGNSLYDYTAYFLETAGTRGVTRSIQKSSLDYWEKPGDVGVLPRPTNIANADGSLNYFRTGNSRYLKDASYIRLRDVTISYTLPRSATSFLHISNTRLYVTGSNLWTLTKYPGPDPEVNVAADSRNGLVQGLDFGTPPQPVSVVFGINLSF